MVAGYEPQTPEFSTGFDFQVSGPERVLELSKFQEWLKRVIGGFVRTKRGGSAGEGVQVRDPKPSTDDRETQEGR